jgi:molecular chaperone GrpE
MPAANATGSAGESLQNLVMARSGLEPRPGERRALGRLEKAAPDPRFKPDLFIHAAALMSETEKTIKDQSTFDQTQSTTFNFGSIGGVGPEDRIKELEADLAELKAKNVELADSYLRAKAEAENARRRADEEIAKARKFAVEAFAESLLPVTDSLEAGLQIKDASAEQIRIGTEATLKQLKSALERNRVMEIAPPAGTKFDPHQHQAISVVPAEQEPNTVVGVLQKGYLIADRVLRPALVTVAAPK